MHLLCNQSLLFWNHAFMINTLICIFICNGIVSSSSLMAIVISCIVLLFFYLSEICIWNMFICGTLRSLGICSMAGMTNIWPFYCIGWLPIIKPQYSPCPVLGSEVIRRNCYICEYLWSFKRDYVFKYILSRSLGAPTSAVDWNGNLYVHLWLTQLLVISGFSWHTYR